ncbi:MAG: HepT-like ribonuclease domain-containing protein [bacterium]
MSKRDFRDSLIDIWKEIEHIERFSASLDYEGLMEDEKSLYAIVRCFEIIGEAVKNIPEEVKEKYCQIPWKDMAGMRDKL